MPKTCENFILLCKRGYYDGVQFHRSIPNFMVRYTCPAFITVFCRSDRLNAIRSKAVIQRAQAKVVSVHSVANSKTSLHPNWYSVTAKLVVLHFAASELTPCDCDCSRTMLVECSQWQTLAQTRTVHSSSSHSRRVRIWTRNTPYSAGAVAAVHLLSLFVLCCSHQLLLWL